MQKGWHYMILMCRASNKSLEPIMFFVATTTTWWTFDSRFITFIIAPCKRSCCCACEKNNKIWKELLSMRRKKQWKPSGSCFPDHTPVAQRGRVKSFWGKIDGREKFEAIIGCARKSGLYEFEGFRQAGWENLGKMWWELGKKYFKEDFGI